MHPLHSPPVHEQTVKIFPNRPSGLDAHQCVVDVFHPPPSTILGQNLKGSYGLAPQDGYAPKVYPASIRITSLGMTMGRISGSPVCPLSQTLFVLASSSAERG